MNFDISYSFTDHNLNGVNGHFRADKTLKQINADTDFEAVNEFLREYENSPDTLRGYTKECTRLLIWSVIHLGKPLSSMTRNDFDTYIKFLENPLPEWCGKKTSKDSEDWRPFTGPMSNSAKRTSIASINSLLNWLVNAGYLSGNPLGLIRARNKNKSLPTQYKKVERFLDPDMWSALLNTVESMPLNNDADRYNQERMRFMLSTFTLLGGRISEVSKTKFSDFKSTVGGWFWEVTGKGEKDATVAMPKDMVDAMMRWRKFLGLSPLPKTNENIPALPYVNKNYQPDFTKQGIKPRRINQILKEFFERAAIELSLGGQEDKAEKIMMASAHWLRHTSITQKVDAGIDRYLVQIEARHADAKTTNMYTHDEEKVRSQEAQKHKLGWSET
jgi:site-specific recombinase XerD